MTIPRRRIVRPAPSANHNPQRLQRARDRLDKERIALARWMRRLRRAFRSVER